MKLLSLSRTGLLVFVAVCGCGETPGPVTTATPEDASVSAVDECRRKLSSAVQRIQPEAMSGQIRREQVVASLNSWLASCAESDVEAVKISEANAGMLSPATLRTASAVRFTENDIGYIRDCLLLKSLTESLWKQSDAQSGDGTANAGGGSVAGDRHRVVSLFRYLVRNLALLNPGEERVPVSLYEVLMTGRGTVEDRIWIFAEALRQRQLDAVLIKASAPGDAASNDLLQAADLLMGVVVDNGLLLFDPVRGTPVPKPGDTSALISDPAGLDVITGSDRWKSASIFVVCHPSAPAPRMMVLQERLEASDTAVLYEELAGGTSEIHPLQKRLGDVVGSVWPPENLKMWDLPEQRIAAAAALTEQQQHSFTMLMRPFDSPFERDSLLVDDDLINEASLNQQELSEEQKMQMKLEALAKKLERSDELFGKPSHRLNGARLGQVMGHTDVDMIQDLQQIRIACMQEKIELQIRVNEKQAMVLPPVPLPKAIMDVQRSAVGDTLYWMSLCQMSRNEMGTAVATLRNYRKQYPDEKTVMASMLNETEALIEMGDLKSAATVLAAADVDGNSDRARARWLLSRLGAATAPAETTPSDN